MENFKIQHKMNLADKITLKLIEIIYELLLLFKSKYFYLGLITLVLGIQLNIFSQFYLHYYMDNGKALPVLSDLILDNIPLWDIDYIYDIFSLVSSFAFIFYVIHKREYSRVPYFLLVCGLFHLVRGVFIVLTPFGNPPHFDGTEGLFNGFAKYELGVYPSGHIGISYMYFLLAKNKTYRILLILCVITIIAALFLSRGHYSIDVLSGIFFAYAIRSFGDKYLTSFVINKRRNYGYNKQENV